MIHKFEQSTLSGFSTGTAGAAEQNMNCLASGSALLSSAFCLVISFLPCYQPFKTSHHTPTQVLPGMVKCFWWRWLWCNIFFSLFACQTSTPHSPVLNAFDNLNLNLYGCSVVQILLPALVIIFWWNYVIYGECGCLCSKGVSGRLRELPLIRHFS